MGQKAREQVPERHPTLLREEHDRQDPPSVRIGGQELIGSVTRIQAQQPEATAGDQGRIIRLNPGVVERLKSSPMAAKTHMARGMRWWRG